MWGTNKLLCDSTTVRYQIQFVPWDIKVYRKNRDIIGDVFSFGGCNEICFDLATYENLNACNE